MGEVLSGATVDTAASMSTERRCRRSSLTGVEKGEEMWLVAFAEEGKAEMRSAGGMGNIREDWS